MAVGKQFRLRRRIFGPRLEIYLLPKTFRDSDKIPLRYYFRSLNYDSSKICICIKIKLCLSDAKINGASREVSFLKKILMLNKTSEARLKITFATCNLPDLVGPSPT